MRVLEVDQVSKKYKLGVFGGQTLSDEFSALWAKWRGKSNPLISIGDEARANEKGEFWALRDISFSLDEGEVLGIIGKNGAGKSTLLKLLSRITAPSSGEIRIKGRMASLLEVGTGFHTELTGRENIFLNGAILGMRRSEVNSRLSEIIAFSGIEHHIDTPVKRYSSGMKVRLGFSVAAHLNPEILVIDEVLAVGDAEFQKKCIGKMRDVAGQGRTILFVSHNMASVKTLCSRAIMLEQGKLVKSGSVEEIVSSYITSNMQQLQLNNEMLFNAAGKEGVKLLSANLYFENEYITMDSSFEISFRYQVEEEIPNFHLGIQLLNEEGTVILGSGFFEYDKSFSQHDPGSYEAKCFIPGNLLNSGFYSIRVLLVKENKLIQKHDEALVFQIEEGRLEGRSRFNRRVGIIRPLLQWNKTRLVQNNEVKNLPNI
jgi:lipopolysaccharide transport system ATP-binding protein